ncbi:unnamed protein product [Wuchereria bancrofti]|uniref:Uncharacterized protein n=1 Tax=Wuchereria bancrofti TaxID=6293 RepID=A0A3P7DZ47_WUCBA|nr:unnamed protein product [Wuchereria bancrofti]
MYKCAIFAIKFAENERGAGSGRTTAFSSHNWPDDLIDIVNEPMGQTLDRMKKYSNSLSQVDRDGTEEGGPIRERVEERYQRSYKEVCLIISIEIVFFFSLFFL